jgi:hypothetical protein
MHAPPLEPTIRGGILRPANASEKSSARTAWESQDVDRMAAETFQAVRAHAHGSVIAKTLPCEPRSFIV